MWFGVITLDYYSCLGLDVCCCRFASLFYLLEILYGGMGCVLFIRVSCFVVGWEMGGLARLWVCLGCLRDSIAGDCF